MAPSCKLRLVRFSAKLRFQDRAECGNNECGRTNILCIRAGDDIMSFIVSVATGKLSVDYYDAQVLAFNTRLK